MLRNKIRRHTDDDEPPEEVPVHDVNNDFPDNIRADGPLFTHG